MIPEPLTREEIMSAARQQHWEPYSAREVFCAAIQLCGVPYHELVGPYRYRRTTGARRLVVGAVRSLTRASFPEIAKLMARRHHSSTFTQHARYKTMTEDDRQRWQQAVADEIHRMRGLGIARRISA